MTLPDKLKAIEPERITVTTETTRQHYVRDHEFNKMRDIAVLLSEALEPYAKQDNSSNMFIVDYVSPSVACEALAKCETLLKEGNK